ncbi:zinc-binding dehydrogenase [Leptolyngbya sp. FACHB-261]|uniref:zinc-dependent alcohol dehydrogenase n=1 Tax=Leptolyngbya sp. FACHB-261 TaxID=2692806 RepID=UPI00168A2EF3|nr:zinc-binding dehydrogenase [Leptolyngbya sp. FACHB-261]MBD2102875.1 zinc-binding dehydrogenase [Leptolyngbya sp. FACHB-261]
MLAALLYGQEDLRLEDLPRPEPGPGEIVVQVSVATTCGTDLKVWRRGNHAKMLGANGGPVPFGHEFAGVITSLGEGISDWQIGERVIANNSAPCGVCFYCQRQQVSLCSDLTFNNGTFAEYLRIPAAIVRSNLLRIPDPLPDYLAALTEPLACVLHGAARSNVRSGDTVAVLGDGAIGLMFVAALQQWDVKVLLFGGQPERLILGQQLGATAVFNYHELADIPAVVREHTQGQGADVVIEAAGVTTAWETAIACARPGATVNLFGGCPRNTQISVSTERLHYSELTLKGVFHNTPYYVREALGLLSSRRFPLELLVSDQQPLSNIEQVFQQMKARKALKVALRPSA